MIFVSRSNTWLSTASKAASNNACFPLKWWYNAPLVTLARFATSSSEVPAYPRFVNSSTALSTKAARVDSE
jgi:hypothetical protein